MPVTLNRIIRIMKKSLFSFFLLFNICIASSFAICSSGDTLNRHRDTLNCYELFKFLYYQAYGDDVFAWDSEDLAVGQKNYLYYVKFSFFEQSPLYPEKMMEELNKLCDFLESNPNICVKLIIHNSHWSVYFISYFYSQKEFISSHLVANGISEDRFKVELDKIPFMLIKGDNPVLSHFWCSGFYSGINPYFLINSWLDVMIMSIE